MFAHVFSDEQNLRQVSLPGATGRAPGLGLEGQAPALCSVQDAAQRPSDWHMKKQVQGSLGAGLPPKHSTPPRPLTISVTLGKAPDFHTLCLLTCQTTKECATLQRPFGVFREYPKTLLFLTMSAA